METKTFSYRYAEEILQHSKYKGAYDEILTLCKECPIPVYKSKSKVQQGKDVIQQLMNTYFSRRLQRLDWKLEPNVCPESSDSKLRADFRKRFTGLTAQMEVEFGNGASSYRNYFKFQLAYNNGLTDLGILILPSRKLGLRIDSGLSEYEKTCRELPLAKASITVPILVIGLFDDDSSYEWDVKTVEPNLSILKGNSRQVIDAHNAIVDNYIQTLI